MKARVGGWVLFTAIGVLLGGLPWPGAPAGAAVVATWEGTIGGPGHADLYGWGADTMPDGSVLISDYWNLRVQHFETDGRLRRTAVANDGRHQAPYDVAVDPRDGSIYVGDVDGARTVDKYSATGAYIRSFGGPATWQYPAWLDVDSRGRVAVVDSRGHKVVVFDDQGRQLFQFGSLGSGPTQFNTPRGVDFDANDFLYVLDTNNRRVQVFDLRGATGALPVRRWPVQGADFRGLTVNRSNGFVYLVSAGTARVNYYHPVTGSLLGGWGSFGTGPGQFVEGGRALTFDGDGNLWVGDMPNFRAQKFSPTGAFLQAVQEPPAPPPPGGFNLPGGVATDAAGTIFVTDTFNWRIQKLSPAGAFVAQWGNRGTLNYARGIAVDRRDGSVVVGNTDAQNLRKYGNNGQLLWTTTGVRSFSVAVAADGTIYAADFAANVVRVYNANGTLLRTIGSGRLSDPRGIEVDADGSVWVSNQGTGRVVHLSATGAFLGQFGSLGTATTSLAQAADVEVSATHVFVADKGSHRVKVWSKGGGFAGSFGGWGTQPGQFKGPMGLELTPDGRLLVLEASGERIQAFTVDIT